MHRYLIVFDDRENTKEEILADDFRIYTDKETIQRISFYDEKGNLIACFAGYNIKYFKVLS